jgi:hypothetical protein
MARKKASDVLDFAKKDAKRYYLRNNEGKLFQSVKRGKDSKQPDLRGTVKVNDQLFDISGWVNFKKGSKEKYIELRLREHIVSEPQPLDELLQPGDSTPSPDSSPSSDVHSSTPAPEVDYNEDDMPF